MRSTMNEIVVVSYMDYWDKKLCENSDPRSSGVEVQKEYRVTGWEESNDRGGEEIETRKTTGQESNLEPGLVGRRWTNRLLVGLDLV